MPARNQFNIYESYRESTKKIDELSINNPELREESALEYEIAKALEINKRRTWKHKLKVIDSLLSKATSRREGASEVELNIIGGFAGALQRTLKSRERYFAEHKESATLIREYAQELRDYLERQLPLPKETDIVSAFDGIHISNPGSLELKVEAPKTYKIESYRPGRPFRSLGKIAAMFAIATTTLGIATFSGIKAYNSNENQRDSITAPITKISETQQPKKESLIPTDISLNATSYTEKHILIKTEKIKESGLVRKLFSSVIDNASNIANSLPRLGTTFKEIIERKYKSEELATANAFVTGSIEIIEEVNLPMGPPVPTKFENPYGNARITKEALRLETSERSSEEIYRFIDLNEIKIEKKVEEKQDLGKEGFVPLNTKHKEYPPRFSYIMNGRSQIK